ncbi:hypothetical protein [Lichenibacterium dinghuense]|uniref:hypothetical protein n=1 Tax=Lichenibacterium dinghuense TaxID=2895977 RepID=UPI001F3A3B5C|nr:hypothetical protein [Lichenibacterium sp. 6Y81]
MDSTMNSLPTQAVLGAGTAVLAAVTVALGSAPLAVALISALVVARVAFVAQSGRFRDEERLVYRPVYARRQSVQRRVRSDD